MKIRIWRNTSLVFQHYEKSPCFLSFFVVYLSKQSFSWMESLSFDIWARVSGYTLERDPNVWTINALFNVEALCRNFLYRITTHRLLFYCFYNWTSIQILTFETWNTFKLIVVFKLNHQYPKNWKYTFSWQNFVISENRCIP